MATFAGAEYSKTSVPHMSFQPDHSLRAPHAAMCDYSWDLLKIPFPGIVLVYIGIKLKLYTLL